MARNISENGGLIQYDHIDHYDELPHYLHFIITNQPLFSDTKSIDQLQFYFTVHSHHADTTFDVSCLPFAFDGQL